MRTWLMLAFALVACAPVPPAAAPTFALGAEVALRYDLRYLPSDRWTAARVRVVAPDGRSWEAQGERPGPDAALRLDLAGVPPGTGYGVTLDLLAQGAVVHTLRREDVALVAGANDLGFGSASAPARPSIAPAGVPEAYVTSLAPFGPAGRLGNVRAIVREPGGRYFVLDDGTIRAIVPDNQGRPTIHTIAGVPSSAGSGFVDGEGQAARFQNALDMARGPDGTLYVADGFNGAIRAVRVGPDLRATVTTVAGNGVPGHADGPGGQARFMTPRALAIDSVGRIYVADMGSHRIRIMTPDGQGGFDVSTFAGDGTAGLVDGAAGAARFNEPNGLALVDDDRLLVADNRNRRVRLITRTAAGSVVTTVAGGAAPIDVDGVGAAASFNNVQTMGRTSAGEILIVSRRVRRVTLRPDGQAELTTVAGASSGGLRLADMPAAQADLAIVRAIGSDEAGRPLFAWQSALMRLEADAAGELRARRFFGSMTLSQAGQVADGPADYSFDFTPNDFALDPTGNLYVATQDTRQVLRLRPDVGALPEVVAGTGEILHRDGPGPSAAFSLPQGMDFDPVANALLVADSGSETVRRIALGSDPAIVSTVLGAADESGDLDGTLADARLHQPFMVKRQPDGSLLLSEGRNRKIRRVTLDGAGRVVTLAGNQTGGNFVDGPGTLATFRSVPAFDIVDPSTLVVADSGNCAMRIVSLAPDGSASVRTMAGGIAGYRDGPLAEARFASPWQVAYDKTTGDYYVIDDARVRRIAADAAGGLAVTTIAGGDKGFADGPGRYARFGRIAGMLLHPDGYLVLADETNRVIRKVTLPWRPKAP